MHARITSHRRGGEADGQHRDEPRLVTLALGAASLTLTDADASLLPLLRANVALNTGSGLADSAAHAEADVASKAGDPKGTSLTRT